MSDFYLLNRYSMVFHDPPKMTKACAASGKLNPKRWHRIPKDSIGEPYRGARSLVVPCYFCVKDDLNWHRWDGRKWQEMPR